MGLMYMFPVSEEEADRVEIQNRNEVKSITLKTYGLPMLFWGYFAAISIVIGAMYIAVSGPIEKLMATGDSINYALGLLALAIMYGIPLFLLCAFFYEKFIIKSQDNLTIKHRLFFGLVTISKKFKLKANDAFYVEHFLDSPNVAKMKNDPTLRGFENKGHYQLWIKLSNDKDLVIDKAARKIDLEKMKSILSKY